MTFQEYIVQLEATVGSTTHETVDEFCEGRWHELTLIRDVTNRHVATWSKTDKEGWLVQY